ncbi:nucleoside deaminase [uncultured Amnibacterium sp.]|uniref:nucleoside deaminase n=1 Tax=uncultured Amnibacterium sp. TaxID=1631851 RepID=UPI0035CA87E3
MAIRAFGAELPTWVDDEVAAARAGLGSDEGRMRLLNRLAERNIAEGSGGPFSALAVRSGSGEVVAAGVNLVLASGLSSMHAEVVTISLAQARLGTWDLGALDDPLELWVNWRPCAMCYGATLWSGVRGLVVAGDGPELEALTGFDEGPMRGDWAQQLEARGVRVRVGVLTDEAVAVFERYGADPDVTVYNARTSSGV